MVSSIYLDIQENELVLFHTWPIPLNIFCLLFTLYMHRWLVDHILQNGHKGASRVGYEGLGLKVVFEANEVSGHC